MFKSILLAGASMLAVIATSAEAGTTTFDTPGAYTWSAPTAGVYKVDVWGAQGGAGVGNFGAYAGGLGAGVWSDLTLSAGQTLSIWVGQQGQDGPFGGGGGGGASAVLLNSSNVSAGAVIAGGGGGGGYGGNYAPQVGDGQTPAPGGPGGSGFGNNDGISGVPGGAGGSFGAPGGYGLGAPGGGLRSAGPYAAGGGFTGGGRGGHAYSKGGGNGGFGFAGGGGGAGSSIGGGGGGGGGFSGGGGGGYSYASLKVPHYYTTYTYQNGQYVPVTSVYYTYYSGGAGEGGGGGGSYISPGLRGGSLGTRSGDGLVQIESLAGVPEPSEWLLMMLGLAFTGHMLRRERWRRARVATAAR